MSAVKAVSSKIRMVNVPAAAAQGESDVSGTLILRVLNDFLEPTGGIAVDLLRQALATRDHLVDRPRKDQMLHRLDGSLGGRTLDGSLIPASLDEQLLKQLHSRRQAALRFQLHANPRTHPALLGPLVHA